MAYFLLLLWLGCVIAFIVGLVKPAAVWPRSAASPSRLKVASVYGAAGVILLLMVGAAAPSGPSPNAPAKAPAERGDGATRTAAQQASAPAPAAVPEQVQPAPAPAPDAAVNTEAAELAARWSYEGEVDPMTSRASHVASIESENTVSFDFPYQGEQHATLSLRDHPSYGRNVYLSIPRGQFLCHVEECSVRVRFDEGAAEAWTANEPADNSSTVLFISGYSRFLAKMRRARVVRIQASFFQEGAPTFEFRTSGFDAARYGGRP